MIDPHVSDLNVTVTASPIEITVIPHEVDPFAKNPVPPPPETLWRIVWRTKEQNQDQILYTEYDLVALRKVREHISGLQNGFKPLQLPVCIRSIHKLVDGWWVPCHYHFGEALAVDPSGPES